MRMQESERGRDASTRMPAGAAPPRRATDQDATAAPGMPADPQRLTVGQVLYLQGTSGNAATSALIGRLNPTEASGPTRQERRRAVAGKGPEGDEPIRGHGVVSQRAGPTKTPAPAPAPARTSQPVAVTPIKAAEDLGRGGFRWKVWFSIPKPATADGWVIQEIVADAKITAKGGAVTTETYHFWEAWQLKKGKTTTIYQDEGLDDNDDMYYTPPRPAGSKGLDITIGDVRFYEGPLPADFKTNNPSTVAGILFSSTTAPPYWSGGGTAHNLTSRWDDSVVPSKTSVTTVPP